MVNILHSFPIKEDKFKLPCTLLFNMDNISNTYVDELSLAINFNQFDFIILHSLRQNDCLFLLKNQLTIPVIWFFWGGEFFNNGKFHSVFLLNRTKRFRRKLFFNLGVVKGIKLLVKETMPWLINLSNAKSVKLATLKNINYIVPVVPGDYYLLKNIYDFKARLFHLNYGNPLAELDSLKNVNGRNIFLGNSSSYTNNHFDAIDDLARIDLEGRKVIIPLSYGDTILAECVSEYAKNKLGENKVFILKEFMSFADYNDILLSCEIVIMNHKRQQAVGNIVQSLLNGSHIYLRMESTVYQYLEDCGFKISGFNNIKILSGLSHEDVHLNRELSKKIFGSELQHQKLQSLINQILSE